MPSRVLFFVSVGMLFNPAIIIEHPLSLFATVFIIVIGKSIAAFVIVLMFRRTIGTALTISASLAQIGEFSFILAELGVGLKLLPEAGRDLILAGAILSIMLNPVIFALCDWLRPILEAKLAPAPATVAVTPAAPPMTPIAADTAPTADPVAIRAEVVVEPYAGMPGAKVEADPDTLKPTLLKDHVVLVGYGRVGSLVGADLRAAGVSLLVIEDTDTRIDAIRKTGWEVIPGNAADPSVMALVGPITRMPMRWCSRSRTPSRPGRSSRPRARPIRIS